MKKYNVIFNEDSEKKLFLEHLNLQDKEVWNIHKTYKLDIVNINKEEIDQVGNDIVRVDVNLKYIEISLTLKEVIQLRKLGYIVEHIHLEKPISLYNQWITKVENIGRFFGQVSAPYETTYFSDGGITTQDRNFSKYSLTNGEIVQPTLYYLNVQKAWEQGLTGVGIKVGVIDGGYNRNHIGHEDVEIVDSMDTTGLINDHNLGRLGDIGAKRNGKGVVGVAYDSLLYTASYNAGLATCFSWMVLQDVKIINCSFATSDNTTPTRLAIKKAIDKGIIINVSAGNNTGADAPINDLAKFNGTTIIGGTDGGFQTEFNDTLTYTSIIPFSNGKGIDFVLPTSSLCPTTSVPGEGLDWDTLLNWYLVIRGTSMSNSLFSGLCTLMIQKYPNLPGPVLINKIKSRCRKITTHSQTFNFPQNIF